jgi:hypothetical protein
MIKIKLLQIILILLCINCFAQEEKIYKESEIGLDLNVNTSGGGIGLFYHKEFLLNYFWGANLNIISIRDEGELTVYDPRFGYIKINDPNDLFLIPVYLDIRRRLFSESIEDNFRPFITIGAGSVQGFNFVKERIGRKNEYSLSAIVRAGVGIDMEFASNFLLSISFKYEFIKFPKKIAGKNDYSGLILSMGFAKRIIK